MELIKTYFSELNSLQISQFRKLQDLYTFWNNQINVISRKDLDYFYERHVLHSLGISKIIEFLPNSKILDVGTGGGFPGIPLAILFPNVSFTLVDSIGKKIKVVNEISNSLELKNVQGINQRAENTNGKFDFIVSRAVTKMPEFIPWIDNKINHQHRHDIKNGILYLKGGDLTEEMSTVRQRYNIYSLSKFFKEDFFETKKIVHVQIP